MKQDVSIWRFEEYFVGIKLLPSKRFLHHKVLQGIREFHCFALESCRRYSQQLCEESHKHRDEFSLTIKQRR